MTAADNAEDPGPAPHTDGPHLTTSPLSWGHSTPHSQTHIKETSTFSNHRKKFLPIKKSAYSSFKIVSQVDKPMQFSSVKTWKHKPGGAGASPHLIVCVVARWRSCWASELLSSATKQIWSLAACHEEARVTSQGYSWDLQIWSLVDPILLTVLIKCEMSSHVRSACIPHCLEIPQVLSIPRQTAEVFTVSGNS